jgi:hypothetical protein
VATLTLALCAAGFARGAAGRDEQAGVFALLDGTPKVKAALWVSPSSGLTGTLNVREFDGDSKPILNYDVDMERVMHMIVVRDDFATFSHLHPDFDATTGTFRQSFTKEPNYRYYVYADSTPHDLPQQVFRFTLDSAGPVANSRPSSTPSNRTVATGPYSVTLSKTTLPAGGPQNLNLTVRENGKPAENLGAYLGAAAHVVFINTSTLVYVHLHPTVLGANDTETSMGADMHMAMPAGGKSGPSMLMAVPALPAGTYKLWAQFLGNGKLYTVPFTLLVR